MFKNHIKIAWRTLWKNKGYSALNIFGLAIGITCAALILLWVEDEVGYDANFQKQDLVYYVPTNQQYEGEWSTFYSTPMLLARDLKEEIPEIVRAVATSSQDLLFTEGEHKINRQGRYANTDVFEIFNLLFIEGTSKTAFDRPDAIVLTQSTATDLFGANTSVLNKVLRVNNTDNYVITGVIKDLPENVTFGFDWLAPFDRYSSGVEWMQDYGSNFTDTFVELAPRADFDAVNAKVQKMIPSKTDQANTYAFLHSMKDWHLRSNFEDGKKVGGQIVYVSLFTLIALVIVLIACINFMNLSTARSEKRAKEVGVRKVLGSGKGRLVAQFISEALITATLASTVSIFLVLVLLPEFNQLVEKQIELTFFSPLHLLFLLGITIVCGLLAGWYPAFYLSSFKPVEVIKGIKTKEGSASIIRKVLVVAQFVVSIIFIISTIIVYQQVQHAKGRDLGYEKDNLIKLNVNGEMVKNFNPIRQDMIASGMVENVGLNNSEVLKGGNNGSGFRWKGGANTEDVLISFRHITPSFLETAGMKLLEGSNFHDNVGADGTNVLISESLAIMMGEGSAVGKTIIWGETFTIIGVVKDYVFGDMYGSAEPVLFFNNPEYANYLYVRGKSGIAMNEILTTIEEVMKKHNPAFPFEYEFVDDAFNAMFKSEKLMGSLSKIFALLAVVISCLGLFGLSAFTAERRRKEIGVRKVLGSSITNIVRLLSRDFMQLVGIAILIASPIAWLLMQNWLEGFAYRISINLWVFVIAASVAICIALLTVSFQAFKAARANPVKSLRTE